MQVPYDDGDCAKLLTEDDCMSVRRSVFDSSLLYCQWSEKRALETTVMLCEYRSESFDTAVMSF